MCSQRLNAGGRKSSEEESRLVKAQKQTSPVVFASSYGTSLQVLARQSFARISDATFMEDRVSLSVMAGAYGDMTAISFIKAHLIGVNDYVNVKKKLTDEQLQEVAEQIFVERYYLNQYELILFCSKLRSGDYEDFYGSIDPMRIMKSLDTFCRDRRDSIHRKEQEDMERKRAEEEKERQSKTMTYAEWLQLKAQQEQAKEL